MGWWGGRDGQKKRSCSLDELLQNVDGAAVQPSPPPRSVCKTQIDKRRNTKIITERKHLYIHIHLIGKNQPVHTQMTLTAEKSLGHRSDADFKGHLLRTL